MSGQGGTQVTEHLLTMSNYTTPVANTSYEQYLSPYQSTLSPAEDWFYAVALIIIGAVSLVLNMSVLHVAFRRIHLLKPLEYHIVHMAGLSLMMVLTMYPMTVASLIAHTWLTGDVGCRYYGFIGTYIGMADIANLTILGVLRYIKICLNHPGWSIETRYVFKLCMALTHTFALVISIMPLLGWGGYGLEGHRTSCSVDWMNKTSRSYITTLLVIGFIIPLSIITFCYSKIYVHSRSDTPTQPRKSPKLGKMVLLITIGFVFTWTPYALVLAYGTYIDADGLTPSLTAVPTIFAKLANILNPGIYFFCIKKFRTHAWQALRSIVCKGKVEPIETVDSLPREQREPPEAEGALRRLPGKEIFSDISSSVNDLDLHGRNPHHSRLVQVAEAYNASISEPESVPPDNINMVTIHNDNTVQDPMPVIETTS